MLCPCCSLRPFEQCCKPYLVGDALPPNPEALMRSRYSAYALKHIDYLVTTHATSTREENLAQGVADFANQVIFTQLTVLHAKDDTVHFKAHFLTTGDVLEEMEEVSHFVKEDGQWRYESGQLAPSKGQKIKRNQACPCNSGKKYKVCHGPKVAAL